MSLGQDIELIQDVATREAMRALALRVQELEEAEAATTDLAAIQTALQRGGSNQLDVTGLVGILAQAQRPAVGYAHYVQTATQSGAGLYVWDKEVRNTIPRSVRRNASQQQFDFKDDGFYVCIANVDSGGAGVCWIAVNGVGIGLHTLAAAGWCSVTGAGIIKAGSRLDVRNTAGDRISVLEATALYIIRLT